MRPVGYILLLIGFICLFGRQMDLFEDADRTAAREYGRLPEKPSYTKLEVADAAQNATYYLARRYGNGVLSGFLMLIGGILLDRASKGRSPSKHAVEPGAPPNGGPAAPIGSSRVADGPPSVS